MSVKHTNKYTYLLTTGRHAVQFTYIKDDGSTECDVIVPAGTMTEYRQWLPPGKWHTKELIQETFQLEDEEVLIRDMLKGIREDLKHAGYDEMARSDAFDKVDISLEYLDRYKRAWRMIDGKKTWYRLVPDHDVTDADDS